MSRDEWCKMWESIKTLELYWLAHQCTIEICPHPSCIIIKGHIDLVKKQIQQEIGQME